MPSKPPFKIGVAFIFIATILLIWRCDFKQETMGYQHRIFVVSDSLFWDEVNEPIEKRFQNIIYTPHVENSFYLTPIPLKDLNEFKYRMNLMFIGTAKGNDKVSQYLREIIPEDFRKGVDAGRYFYLFNEDMFARDQIGMVLYARDKQDFLQKFNTYKNEIYNKFEDQYYTRLEKSMFEHGYLERIADFLKENYGWYVKVQHDYFIALQDFDHKYVWLRRLDPHRWLSIWELKADSSMLVRDSLIQIRDRMANMFYEGDAIVQEDTYIKETEFRGQRTRKLVGVWENDSLLVGGPFRSYAVHRPETSTLYFIDIAVMAPGKNKKPYLDQLEVIAGTFTVMKHEANK